MNTQYSDLVGTLSRALGNTLTDYRVVDKVLTLQLQYKLSADERNSLRIVTKAMYPRSKVTFGPYTVTISE